MSKLEDKLAASIKPARKQPVAKAPAAMPTPESPPLPAPTPAAADLNSRAQPPHPRRIWPD
ncbi:MAG: hypothetical protein Q8Q28_00050 [Pseudomonadota bacterium]|nr:hypothetical protein [Pseudomonadota bacterium]